MFYLLFGILILCFCLHIYRNLKCKDNHTLNQRLGFVIYGLLIADFMIAILY